jgi:hypothetical protein
MVAATAQIAAKPSVCLLTEQAFLGNWSTPAGNEIVRGDVREIAFEYVEGERVFSEWLHHRPMGSGTWRVVSCTVAVHDHDTAIRFRFLGNDGRRLVELPYRPGDPVYRRVN